MQSSGTAVAIAMAMAHSAPDAYLHTSSKSTITTLHASRVPTTWQGASGAAARQIALSTKTNHRHLH